MEEVSERLERREWICEENQRGTDSALRDPTLSAPVSRAVWGPRKCLRLFQIMYAFLGIAAPDFATQSC